MTGPAVSRPQLLRPGRCSFRDGAGTTKGHACRGTNRSRTVTAVRGPIGVRPRRRPRRVKGGQLRLRAPGRPRPGPTLLVRERLTQPPRRAASSSSPLPCRRARWPGCRLDQIPLLGHRARRPGISASRFFLRLVGISAPGPAIRNPGGPATASSSIGGDADPR